MLGQGYEIEKQFEKIVDNETQDIPLNEYLQDVVKYGQNDFYYYSETTELYDEYSSECERWLDDLVEETGMKPGELFNDWEYTINSEHNKRNVIAAMFERYCDDRLEQTEEWWYY